MRVHENVQNHDSVENKIIIFMSNADKFQNVCMQVHSFEKFTSFNGVEVLFSERLSSCVDGHEK